MVVNERASAEQRRERDPALGPGRRDAPAARERQHAGREHVRLAQRELGAVLLVGRAQAVQQIVIVKVIETKVAL